MTEREKSREAHANVEWAKSHPIASHLAEMSDEEFAQIQAEAEKKRRALYEELASAIERHRSAKKFESLCAALRRGRPSDRQVNLARILAEETKK